MNKIKCKKTLLNRVNDNITKYEIIVMIKVNLFVRQCKNRYSKVTRKKWFEYKKLETSDSMAFLCITKLN